MLHNQVSELQIKYKVMFLCMNLGSFALYFYFENTAFVLVSETQLCRLCLCAHHVIMCLFNKHMITSTVLVMTAQSVFTFVSCVAT